MEIDRKTFLDSLGGTGAVGRMDSEARADALEHRMMAELNTVVAGKQSGGHQDPANCQPGKYPTAAEVEAAIQGGCGFSDRAAHG
jgi:hypothetical protein